MYVFDNTKTVLHTNDVFHKVVHGVKMYNVNNYSNRENWGVLWRAS